MPAPWTKAMPGQTVTLRGVAFSVALTVLDQCEIVAVTGAEIPLIGAVDLAKRFDAEPRRKTVMRFKYLRVAGEVSKATTDAGGGRLLELKTSGKLRLTCRFPVHEAEETAAIAVGQQAKVIGKCFVFASGDDELELLSCCLIPD
jgi:hypothetical protein